MLIFTLSALNSTHRQYKWWMALPFWKVKSMQDNLNLYSFCGQQGATSVIQKEFWLCLNLWENYPSSNLFTISGNIFYCLNHQLEDSFKTAWYSFCKLWSQSICYGVATLLLTSLYHGGIEEWKCVSLTAPPCWWNWPLKGPKNYGDGDHNGKNEALKQ